jgi:hypothetical protein
VQASAAAALHWFPHVLEDHTGNRLFLGVLYTVRCRENKIDKNTVIILTAGDLHLDVIYTGLNSAEKEGIMFLRTELLPANNQIRIVRSRNKAFLAE